MHIGSVGKALENRDWIAFEGPQHTRCGVWRRITHRSNIILINHYRV